MQDCYNTCMVRSIVGSRIKWQVVALFLRGLSLSKKTKRWTRLATNLFDSLSAACHGEGPGSRRQQTNQPYSSIQPWCHDDLPLVSPIASFCHTSMLVACDSAAGSGPGRRLVSSSDRGWDVWSWATSRIVLDHADDEGSSRMPVQFATPSQCDSVFKR